MSRATGTILLAFGLFSLPVLGAAEEVLRFYVDPDNLPFSSSRAAEPGLYVELAEIMAVWMGVRAEYEWWLSYFGGRRAVRRTLLAGRCDAYFVGYVIVAPKFLSISGLDDLKGKTIGLEFASPPQILLSVRDGFYTVTFRLAREVMEAVARREVESAFVWGPVAGYYDKTKLGADSRSSRSVVAACSGKWRSASGRGTRTSRRDSTVSWSR